MKLTSDDGRRAVVQNPSSYPHRSERPFRLKATTGWLFISLLLAALACVRSNSAPDRLIDPWFGFGPRLTATASPTAVPSATATEHPLMYLLPPTRAPGEPYHTPTPDPLRSPPPTRVRPRSYVVRPGDTLNQIAVNVGVAAHQIMAANGLLNPDLLSVGQTLEIPTPYPAAPGPSFKIIPDSELVYAPASALFDLEEEVRRWDGQLNRYRELVEGEERTGVEILQRVAQRYSVNPRLLLALLEYQSGWLTRSDVAPLSLNYPMGFVKDGWEGLFSQLSWAADRLNAGYYLWRAGWAGPYVLADGSSVTPGEGINAGTAGVQYLFSQIQPEAIWRQMVGEDGFYLVNTLLFGNPFDRTIEPLLPGDLAQPPMQLPFERGKTWSYTGGPHGGWGNGSAWAALDFAPPGEALGCVLSNEWVTAVVGGLVLRSDYGEVIQDLDGDGFEQTGWVILYMHVEERDRVKPGAHLEAGDRIGHPSCEGGVSSGTHLHIARKYNGEWIPADGGIPFVMDGWVSAGLGLQYDGTLSRAGLTLEACACRSPHNQISR